jgi:flagellar hook assembly protein FlgD
MMGRTIKTLQNGKMDRGRYAMDWNATDALGQKISSGVYFIKLTSESYQKTIKVLYLK